jgi:uncharacterized membrane protein (UPF0182 family)
MRNFKTTIVLLGLLLIWAALAGGIHVYIESLWFHSLGFWDVFYTFVFARFRFFLLGMAVALVLLGLNVWLSSRKALGDFWFKPEWGEIAQRGTRFIFWIAAIGFSVLAGVAFQANWMKLLQYLNQVPTGITDPIFGRDLAFYFFSLPVWNLAVNFALAMTVIALLLAAVNYLVHGHLGYRNGVRFSTGAKIHLTVLLALILVWIAGRFWLSRFDLLYSRGGAVFGAGYADLYAWLPCYWILTVLALVTALGLLVSTAAKTIRPVAVAAISFGVAYLLLSFYPSLIQTFVVAPNELQKETPFIRNNIQSTLHAYKLDDIETHDFSPSRILTESDLQRNQGTLRNIRLWDWRPLKNAYDQLQTIRLYYDFEDADVDRYIIENQYRQVMLSVRELDFTKISESAQNWINKHFQYTHGQGLCMSPVNEVTDEGLPEFFIKDIPPRSTVDLEIERPEIYFGEKTDYPVFVRTELEEFDYPIGDQNATTTYKADRGLPINSLIMRLLFSWELGIYQILFTDNFNEDSRVLLHREIRDRISRLAPFLLYDRDPYAVIHQGRLVWILDGYTVTDRYPYSEPFPDRNAGRYNYIRNAVKAVVDAYTGDVTFYITDPSDPLIQVYARIFPSLFHPLEQMPETLRAHIRYPVDFFDVQRFMFGRYHMKDPTVFYNQEDLWEVPTEIYGGNEQLMESYYVIMSLPGESQEEFILLIPYTPRNKNNMVAWLAARSDAEHYGKLVLYQFPKQELTYGPMQIEARIDQNPEISQLITLWGQKGSQVIRGNLLVIPIEQSLLYIEPLYLQAEKSEIPELTRIIAVYRNQVALGETLEEALDSAIFRSPRRSAAQTARFSQETDASDAIPLNREELVSNALELYEASQQHLREGNWTAYGEDQRKLGEILRKLQDQSLP